MTMKEMFKKVETYNEIAEMMRTDKAYICFADIQGTWSHGERFTTYPDFRKYIRSEYHKEIADKILKSEEFEIDGEINFTWSGGDATFSAELTA